MREEFCEKNFLCLHFFPKYFCSLSRQRPYWFKVWMEGGPPPPLHEPIRKISSKPKNTTRGGLRRFCRVDTANTIENPRSAHFSPMRSMLLNGVTQNGNRKIGVAGKSA